MNIQVDIKISKRELQKIIHYFEDSGYEVTRKYVDENHVIYNSTLKEYNFGTIAESIKSANRWDNFLYIRIPRKEEQ